MKRYKVMNFIIPYIKKALMWREGNNYVLEKTMVTSYDVVQEPIGQDGGIRFRDDDGKHFYKRQIMKYMKCMTT